MSNLGIGDTHHQRRGDSESDSDSDSESDGEVGAQAPPLTKQISNILNRYPEGGQILKELIQNADDAQATKVGFLIDWRDHPIEPGDVMFQNFEKYQGPALYAWNDAVFKKNDWHSLGKINQSSKEEDVLKVGRFGLGFQSVFHITDLPMVVSQKHIAVIDPHRKCIKPKSETSPAGTKKKLSSIFRYKGHVSAFESMFNLNTKVKKYDGTIFRFPLRQSGSVSEISTKVYTPEMIQEKLFESLKEESPYILLFLRNIKSISLFEWPEGSSQSFETFQVTAAINQVVDRHISDDEAAVPRCEVFAKQCSQSSETDDSEVYLELKSTTVSVTSYDYTDPHSDNHYWLVLKVVGTNDHELDTLGKELSILPWVGLATRLPGQIALCGCEATTTSPFDDCTTVETVFKQLQTSLERSQQSITWARENVETSTGHAYCFLPLPETTAMPVHVHGYFAVTDNRRSIKWPAHDEKGKEAQWNRELLLKMVAPAYALLLTSRATLIHYEDTPLPITNTENMTDPYSTWPLYPEVKNVPIWNELLSPTLGFALPLPLLWTSACGGKWVQFSEAYFLPGSFSANSNTCSNVVIQLLIKLDIPVVSLPRNICETIKQNQHALEIVNHKEISPEFVRVVIRKPDCCSHLSRVEAYDLLDYILSDLNETNYHDLVDIHLLPLKEKSQMITFQKPNEQNHKYIFPSQSKALLELIPGADHLIIDPDFPENINKKMCEISGTGSLQLKKADSDALCKKLLPVSIYSWCKEKSGYGWKWLPGESSMPPQTWMNALWKWIASSNISLSALERLPIIPQLPFESFEQVEVTLLEVRKTGKLCRISPHFSTQDKTVLMQIVKKLDFLVVDESRMSNKEFTTDFEEYIPELTRTLELIIKYFHGLGGSNRLQSIQMLSYHERDFLRKEVNGLRESCNKYQSCLKSIPIYRAACSNEHSANFIALSSPNNGQEAFLSPENIPPLPDYPKSMLCPAVVEEEKLFFKALSVKQLTLSDLCKNHLIPLALEHIKSNPCSWSVGDDLIIWILKQQQKLPEEILCCLSKNEIVYTCDSTHKKPQDIYDPQDLKLTILFDVNTDKHCFPYEQYLHDTNCSRALLTMGMKTWKDFENDVVQMCTLLHDRMKSVSSLQSLAQFTRAQFILQKVSKLNSSSLEKKLERVQFLQAEDCPLAYPPALKEKWFGQNSNRLYSIEELCLPSRNIYNLVGTVKPILSNNYCSGQYAVSASACQNLAFQKLTKEAVTNHLEQIHLATVSEKDIDGLDEVIISIYDYLLVHSGGQTLSLIWQRDSETPGFISASKFVLNKPEGLQVNLEPFYYFLQAPICKYEHLFQLHEQLTPADVALVLKEMGAEVLTKNQSRVCISILNWLCEKNYRETGTLMLTEDNTLSSAKKCVYDDRNWMKHSKSRGHIKGKSLIFVHDQIPQKVARHFEVVPLSCKVAPSQKLGISYTRAGQHEDITQRIRHIVQDYETNIDIFKELIQNADDARATEVKFLIDWRKHPKETLIAEELKEWQGPALFAYNNATFSDEDFRNICLVAGETKRSNPLKTGRFGVGFCATYHLTDIPSFISRRFFTMFDPHTSYLGDRVSHQEPGMRVDLVENQADLELYHDQFAPYEFVFDCNVFDLNGDGYQGTIFRFPFRSKHTSERSRICDKIYDRQQMLTLLEAMKEQCNDLLLFLKHVRKVSLFQLEEDQDPRTPCEAFSIQKSGNSADRIELIKNYSNTPLAINGERTCSSKFEIKVQEAGKESSKTCWMISTAIKSPSHSMLSHPESAGLLPLAEVAIKLEPSEENFKFLPHIGFDINRIFCFLPLPIEIELPFHVNGFFSIGKDRRNISATDDKTFGSQWNKSLAEGALVSAYVHLLQTLCSDCDLKCVSSPEMKQRYLSRYYSLWNFKTAKGLIGSSFRAAFKQCIPTLSCPLFWSEKNGGCWLSPVQAEVFKDKNLQLVSETDKSNRKQSILQDATSLLLKYGHGIVELRLSVYELVKTSMVSSGRVYDYKKFATELFFPNIDFIDESVRDRNIIFLVEKIGAYQGENSWYKWAEEFLSKEQCIRCQNSNMLRPACQLIDAGNKLFKNLFFDNEGRFPCEELQNSRVAVDGLIKLGMASRRLSVADLKERANSVMLLCYEDAVKRSKYICEYIESTYDNRYYSIYFSKSDKKELKQLSTIPFLSVRKKPSDVEVPWCVTEKQFESPSQLYSPHYEHVLFSQHVIVDLASNKVLEGLEISSRKPTPDSVIAHLKCLVRHVRGKPNEATVKFLDESISSVYKYLEAQISSPNVVKNLTQLERFIWQDGYFLSPREVLCHWRHNCMPYMSELSTANKKFQKLFNTVDVKNEEDLEILVDILKRIAEDHGDSKPISNDVLEFIEFVSGRLHHKLTTSTTVDANQLVIYLPDENRIMRTVSELADNVGSDWIKGLPVFQDFISGDKGYFVHSSIPRERAIKLGINPLLEAVLKEIEDDNFLSGTDFGQHEDLCDRLNGILRKYPADISIFKEFIQNADDAQASEIVFVLDHRVEFPDRSLLCSNSKWKSLQHTPALCIFNNRKFTEVDIEGITKLGRGGKRGSEDLIGKFGIGFNVAYHVTDCPSFISYSESGDPEYLCVFDPTRTFAPRATKQSPGRKWNFKYKQHHSGFPDQFTPYLSEDLPQFSEYAPDCMKDYMECGYVVFRLPLTRLKYPRMTKLSSGSVFHPRNISTLFKEFATISQDLLLFLNHIKRVSAFEILKDGKHVHHFTTTASVPSKYLHNCLQFSQNLKKLSKAIHEGRSCQRVSIPHMVDIVRTQPDLVTQTSQWLVQRVIDGGTIQVKQLQDGLRQGLRPIAGVATRLMPTSAEHKYLLFCFLPLPIQSNLPVHVNAHFLLDDSRKHLESIPHAGLDNWNEIVAQNVIVPAYIDLIMTIKGMLNDGTVHESKDFYYSLFPKAHSERLSVKSDELEKVGEISNLNIVNTFYHELLQQNLSLLIREMPANSCVKNEWMKMKGSLFCIPFISKVTTKWLRISGNLRKTLVSLGLPITSAPNYIYHQCETVDHSYPTLAIVTPDKVIKHLQQLHYTITEEQKEIIKNNLYDLLYFCVSGYKSHDIPHLFDNAIYLLAKDGSLQQGHLFRSEFSNLLPHCQRNFIDKTLESSEVGQTLLKCNVIRVLPLKFVSVNIQLPSTDFMCDLCDSDKNIINLFWKYLKKYSSMMPKQNIPHLLIKYCSRKAIIPTSDGKLYPVRLSKTLVRDNCACENCNVMKKLGYSQIDFQKIGATVMPRDIMTELTCCFQNGLNVLECFVLKVPTLVNIQLTEDEVLSFTTSLGKMPQGRLKQFSQCLVKMPLFHTIDGSLISLCGVTTVFVLASSNIPLEGIPTSHKGQVVLKAPTSPSVKKFYNEVIPRDISECVSAEQFYMKLILPILSELQEKNIKKHIDFLYLQREDMKSAFSQLKMTPFIKHNDQIYRGCDLCDPTVQFFILFQPHLVLPSAWREKLDILKCLGLQTKVTTSEWLRSAQEFSIGATGDKNAKQKSEILLNELQNIVNHRLQLSASSDSDSDFLYFLHDVADIEFIYSPQTSAELNKIISIMFPKEKRNSDHCQKMVKFNGSVSPRQANLTCLCKPVLPNNTACQSLIHHGIRRFLRVEYPATPETVAMNLKCLCNCLSTSFARFPTTSSQYVKKLTEIFDEHYTSLSASKLSATGSVICALRDERCVLRSKSLLLQLVKPCQLVMHLPSDCQLEPYCFKVDQWLQKHADFLTALGVKQELEAQDYINMFDNIKKELEGDNIAPTKVIESAYKELISRLRRGDKIEKKSSTVLYLPDEELKLTKVSELYLGDVPWYKNRLPANFSLKMIFDPPTDDKGHRTLPECLNVQRLSDIVVEQLHENCKSADFVCTDEELFTIGKRQESGRCMFVKNILETLKSDELFHGFCRMYYTEYKSPPSESFKLLVQNLKQVSVRCINSELKSVLSINGQSISGTEDTSKLCHLCSDGDLFTVYIAPHGTLLETSDLSPFFKDLAVCISKLLDNELKNMGPISAVFECSPNDISQSLTREHVFEYSTDCALSTKAVTIGTHVPWNRFEPKESLVIINFDPEDPVRYVCEDGSLINAEVVKGGHDGIVDSKITIKVRKVDDSSANGNGKSSEIVVSPLQVFKILTAPQKRSLWSSNTSPYASPLALEAVPLDDESDLQQWLRKVMRPHSGLVQKVLVLRLVGHIHYQAVMQGKCPLLTKKAMLDLLDLCGKKHSNERTELVVDLIKTTIEKITTKDALNDFQVTFPSQTLAVIMNTSESSTRAHCGNSSYYGVQNVPMAMGISSSSGSVYSSTSRHASTSSTGSLNMGSLYPALSGSVTRPQQSSGLKSGNVSSRFTVSRSQRRYVQRPRYHRFQPTQHSAPPQPDICMRSTTAWLEQAIADYNAALLLLGCSVPQGEASCSEGDMVVTDCKFPALVCFLCHDIAEKCIKGVFYAYCGLRQDLVSCNNLVTLCNELKSSRHHPGDVLLKCIEECVMTLSSHEYRCRFPNYQNPPCSPASIYDVEDAQEAYQATLKLLRMLQSQDQLCEILKDLGQLPARRFMSVLQSMPNNQDYPDNWDRMEEDELVKLFPLDPIAESEEYERVINQFLLTLPVATIFKVERVQNKVAWRNYHHRSQVMKDFDKSHLREELLFHGTRDTKPEEIYNVSVGFDTRFSNGGLWGWGTYFAVNSFYSNSYAFNANGTRKMFAAWVLTGNSVYLPRDDNLRTPPFVNNTGKYSTSIQRRYDSVNGSTGGTRVYITYDNDHAYPAYLITYMN